MTTSYPTLQFGLPEEIIMLRDMVHAFAQEHITPIAAEVDKTNEFPRHLWPMMGELGLHGVTVDEEDGGTGLGYLAQTIIIEELARASASVSLSYSAHSNLCINQLRRWGNAEQRAQYLPKLISGEHVGSLAMSEAGSGSDVVSMKLKAEQAQGGYLLNGTKMWITNAPHADVLFVYAKTDPSGGSKGMSAFLITPDMEGFTKSPKLDKLGMRGSDTCELIFEDCFVSDENLVGEVGQGAAILMSGLDYERTTLSGLSVGIMQACLDVVLPYIHERKQFGKSIGEFQLMQGKLADMYVALSSARAYSYAVAAACDRGETTRKDSAGCILYAAEKATLMASDAIQMLGGMGYMNETPTGRLWRDAKLMEIGAGTSEIRRWLIGRELFGETA